MAKYSKIGSSTVSACRRSIATGILPPEKSLNGIQALDRRAAGFAYKVE